MTGTKGSGGTLLGAPMEPQNPDECECQPKHDQVSKQ
jgi:hypothetical protein